MQAPVLEEDHAIAQPPSIQPLPIWPPDATDTLSKGEKEMMHLEDQKKARQEGGKEPHSIMHSKQTGISNERRKKDSEGRPTIQGELRKRAFWCFVYTELSMSAVVGRPPSMNPIEFVPFRLLLLATGLMFSDCHSFDTDLPVDCDDEYLEPPDPKQAFKQPPGRPSRISFFRCLATLLQIHRRLVCSQ